MPHLLALLSALFLILVSSQARAEKRVALVIGNSAYQNTAALKNSKNDARDMASTLTRLGFEVVEGMDLDKRAMERTIRLFATKLGRADVALFFFAGHGVQVGGQNYLLPVDAKLSGEGDVDFESLALTLVLKQMERDAKTSIVLLDACRDNPLARNLARGMGTRSVQIGQGLAEVKAGVGTLIGFSTQPGNVALDGDGHNSPYAAALVKHMETPGKDVSAVLVAVRNDVLHATDGKQVPWEHTSLTGEVYFRPGSAPGATTTNTAPPPAFKTTAPFVPDYDKEMEIAFWNAVKESKSPAVLQTYLDRFPGGTFSGLARVMVDQLKQNQGAKASGGTRVANLPSDASKLPDAPSTNAPALARALQSELKRVGCDPGSIEGNWGAKSKEALRKFQRFSKLSVSADEPTEAALQLVAGQKGRICPLECDRGESEVNGKCVAKAKTDKGRAAESRQKRAPDREREAAPPPGGGIGIGVCVRTGGMAFCAR